MLVLDVGIHKDSFFSFNCCILESNEFFRLRDNGLSMKSNVSGPRTGVISTPANSDLRRSGNVSGPCELALREHSPCGFLYSR